MTLQVVVLLDLSVLYIKLFNPMFCIGALRSCFMSEHIICTTGPALIAVCFLCLGGTPASL